MEQDLKTAFREIFTTYGAALLESGRLVNYLSDWQIGIDRPTKNVVREIVSLGYGKKILEKSKENQLRFEEHELFANEISTATGLMPELVKKVVGSVFYGLGIEKSSITIMENSTEQNVQSIIDNVTTESNIIEGTRADETEQVRFSEVSIGVSIDDIISAGYIPTGKLVANPNTKVVYDIFFSPLNNIEINLVFKKDKWHRKSIASINPSASDIWVKLAKNDFSLIKSIEPIHGYGSIVYSTDGRTMDRTGVVKPIEEIRKDADEVRKRFPALIDWDIDRVNDRSLFTRKTNKGIELWQNRFLSSQKERLVTFPRNCDLVTYLNADKCLEVAVYEKKMVVVVRNSDYKYNPLIFDSNGKLIGKKPSKESQVRRGRYNKLLIRDFFPVDCITLGKTSWQEAIRHGCCIDGKQCNGISKALQLESGITVWDIYGTGIIDGLSFTVGNEVPFGWLTLGMDTSMTYSLWLEWLTSNGFTYAVKETQRAIKILGRETLSTLVEAIDSHHTIIIDLRFVDGDENGMCDSHDSTNSLYSISMKAI